MMERNKKLSNALKRQDKQKVNTPEILSGELGIPIDGNKIVEVPNRRGYVFVRIHGNMSELIQAYNAAVSPIYDLPVLITRQNNVYKIIGRDFDRYPDNWGSVPYLPRHGTQHSFNPAQGMGADTTWVYPQQFMPLLAYPSGSVGSMHLAVNPDFYSWQGQYYYAQATGTPSFTPYLPTITGSAVMTLLYIQPSDNSLQIIAGSPFSNQITGSAQLAQYIPDIDRSVGIPLAAVRLVTGTTSLQWSNVYDVRDFFTIGQGSAGGGLGFVAQDEGILLGTGTALNFVGTNISASISGSVVRVFVTGTTATQAGAIPNDGWILQTATWTRTGNHSFSMTGDVTATYRKGTKVRYKDGSTYEYGVISSSAFATGTTVITLIVNSNYAMAAATITDTYISYIGVPEAFPQWFNWLPTWGGLLSGTVVCKWMEVSQGIHYEASATGPFISGDVTFTPPVASTLAGTRPPVGEIIMLDSGVANYYGVVIQVSSTSFAVRVNNAASTYVTNVSISGIVPFTWGASDELNIKGFYQY